MMELHKIAPLPWYSVGLFIYDADHVRVPVRDETCAAIVEAVNAHFGEGNNKPVQHGDN